MVADYDRERQLNLCEAAILGRGQVDHSACLQALSNSGYTGYLSLKNAGNSAAGPADALAQSLRHLRALAG